MESLCCPIVRRQRPTMPGWLRPAAHLILFVQVQPCLFTAESVVIVIFTAIAIIIIIMITIKKNRGGHRVTTACLAPSCFRGEGKMRRIMVCPTAERSGGGGVGRGGGGGVLSRCTDKVVR